ncbi:MAG: hypothetical protein ABIO39_05750 [Caulobacteraceae bacterium]
MRADVTPPRRSPFLFAAYAAGLLLALALFQHTFGLGLVLAGAPYWASPRGDMVTMVAGALAMLNAPWGFPPTVTHALLAPQPLSVVYTDSIPWLTLALKALGLGRIFSTLGLSLLVSYLMQPVAMIALLRACGVRRAATLFIGAALALLLPAWIARQLGHIALSNHWILLLALALSVESARNGLTQRRAIGFALLAALTVGVHVYHLVPVTAAFGAALLSEVGQRRPAAWRRCILAGLGFVGSVAASAFILGYSVGGGPGGGGAELGLYAMNVAGPVWPQASALFGQTWNGAWFTDALDPTGLSAFEGFNYLGAGVLLLAASAVVVWGRSRRAAGSPATPWRFGPMLLAMAGLTLLAIGPKPYLGMHLLFDLPRPSGTIGMALGLFRAHGRFFWSAAYMIIALALTVLDRRSGRLVLGVGVVALALQALDVGQLRAAVRGQFDHPVSSALPAALTGAVVEGRPWTVVPTYFCAKDAEERGLIADLSLLAVRHHGSVNSAYTARAPAGACEAPVAARVTAGPGDRRLTMVIGRGEAGRVVQRAFAARQDCYYITSGLVCGQGLDRLPGLAPVSRPGAIDVMLAFDTGRPEPALAAGWSDPGTAGVWSDGPTATIVFPAPAAAPTGQVFIEVDASGFHTPSHDTQRVMLSVGGQPVGEWAVEPSVWRPYVLTLPARLVTPDAPVTLRLDLPDAAQVSAVIPGSPDKRRLAIAVRRLTVTH